MTWGKKAPESLRLFKVPVESILFRKSDKLIKAKLITSIVYKDFLKGCLFYQKKGGMLTIIFPIFWQLY